VNLLEKGIEVSFSFVGLYVEENERFGNGASLLLLGLFNFLLFFLKKLFGLLLIINKEAY